MIHTSRRFFVLTLLSLAIIGSADVSNGAASAQPTECRQPRPVCDTRSAVFPISAFDPVASAVRIGENLLVTSRHAVADQTDIDLFLTDGNRIVARVIPTDVKADIILLSAEGLPPGPTLTAAEPGVLSPVYSVGADVSFGGIRAYDPGKVTLLPASGKELARIHHTAYNQPGNSGGALVDANGGLIGIIASGGEGRFEAVPSSTVAGLKERSGPEYAQASAEIGAAIRICTLNLEEMRRSRGPMGDQEAKALDTSCRRTGNRQFYDLAAQAFGSRRMIEASLSLFEASLDQDPNALNSRLGLAVTYHMAARYEEELPHLKILRRRLPEDPQVLRLAIQAGIWGGDEPFARAAFDTLKSINPNMAPAAERFLNSPPPRPPRH